MSKSDTLVVVVSYENPQYTIQTIQHLCDQTYPVDIVMWDNSSSSDTTSKLITADFRGNVEKEFCHNNMLWSPAINHVLNQRAKDYKYVGFMNNDIYLHKCTVGGLIEFLERPEIGLVGPMGSRLGGISDYSHWSQNLSSLDINKSDFGHVAIRGTYLVGACCFLRSDTWWEVGPLDVDMPLGADDHDYAIRMRDAGYQIWADSRYPADHVGHATGASQNWNAWGQKSWDAFNTKWDGYYRGEREAILAHWNGIYMPGWSVGTGWLTDEERKPIYELREKLHSHNKKFPKYNEAYKSNEWNGAF